MRVALLVGLVFGCLGCQAENMEDAEKKLDHEMARYVVWPASAYDTMDGLYIPMLAVPASYPLSSLVEPPQPFGPDNAPVSDGLVVTRFGNSIAVDGGALARMGEAAGQHSSASQALDAQYWSDLNACVGRRVELIDGQGAGSGHSKALICGKEMVVYNEGDKARCVISEDLVASLTDATAPVIGIDGGKDSIELAIYRPGATFATRIDCLNGTKSRMELAEKMHSGADRLVNIFQLLKVSGEWLMVASAKIDDDHLSYVLCSFGTREPVVLGPMARSSVYVSKHQKLLIYMRNDALSEIAEDPRSWTLQVTDLQQPQKQAGDFLIAFGLPVDASRFHYSVVGHDELGGRAQRIQEYEATFAVPSK